MSKSDAVDEVVKVCLAIADKEDTAVGKSVYLLYAELAPGLARFWDSEGGKALKAGEHLDVITNCAATMVANVIRDIAGDDRETMDKIGPGAISIFARNLQMACYMAGSVSKEGKKTAGPGMN